MTGSMSPGELAVVCARFDIGRIASVGPLALGQGARAKVRIETDRGAYVLKRHAARERDAVAASHEVVLRLEAQGLPVAPLVGTREGNASLTEHDGWVYELMGFIEGDRPDGSVPASRLAGSALGRVHDALRGWRPTRALAEEGYHGTPRVRSALRRCGQAHGRALGDDLAERYERAAAAVERAGVKAWARDPMHGDWHPGNVVLRDGEVVGMLDFDSVRIGAAVCDLARALVWFGLAARPTLVAWRDGLDLSLVGAFATGYQRAAGKLDRAQRGALPALMVESLIAEGVLRVAETGRFGRYSAEAFLGTASALASSIEAGVGPLAKALRA